MAGGWRRAARTTVTTTICAALVTAVVPSAAAQPAAPAGSADPATRAEPVETVVPAAYLRSPSPDPWTSDPAELAGSTPDGAILDSRPATIPWFSALRTGPTWQLLVQSRDSEGRPVALPSTVIIPEREWPGPGPRPILSLAAASDGLGATCAPRGAR